MATPVKINIPGIGLVEAQNAATEDTLLKLLEAFKKFGASGTAAAGGGTNPAKAVEDLAKKQKDAGEKVGQAAEAVGKFSTASATGKVVMTELAGAISELAQTTLSLTTAFMTSYDDMAKNPIGAGLTVLQTEVDATASTFKHAVSALVVGAGTLIGGLFGGPVGAALGATVGTAIAGAINSGVDAAAEMQKMYNEQMAKEMQKSVSTLAEYTKMGASFAGGMAEMRQVANNAGIGIETLSKAATKSAADIGASGLTHAEAVKVMAKGMDGLAKTTGKSGASMRDELLALGYSYEEQGEVMASYMAQQRAAGVNLKNLAPEELARGSREYAQNLKVISDITGQDAKKLMEKARAESQRAALMGRLDKDQKAAFTAANSTLSKFGPEVQNALTQFMTLGTVTDPVIAGNANLMKLIQDTAAGVSSADANIAVATGERMKTAQDALAADKMAQATSTAGVAGVAGMAADMGKVYDNILAAQMGSAEASNAAATAQSNLAGASGTAEKGLADLTKATTNQQVAMEKMTGAELGAYANRSAEALAGLTESTRKLQEAINEIHKNVVGPAFEAGGKALEGAASGGWWDSLKNMISPKSGGEGPSFDYNSGFADGGVSTGSEKGHRETLHGTEAVVPLPNGKAIPVTLDGSFDALTEKMDQLLSVSRDTRDLTQKLLHVSQ